MFSVSDLDQLHAMRARADRVRDMIHKRAIRAYCNAFGAEPKADSHLNMCVIHNSILAFENGQPWREVNYSKMRLAARLCEQSFEPGRIVTAWYLRKAGLPT